jgi:hypothetical protein
MAVPGDAERFPVPPIQGGEPGNRFRTAVPERFPTEGTGSHEVPEQDSHFEAKPVNVRRTPWECGRGFTLTGRMTPKAASADGARHGWCSRLTADFTRGW